MPTRTPDWSALASENERLADSHDARPESPGASARALVSQIGDMRSAGSDAADVAELGGYPAR